MYTRRPTTQYETLLALVKRNHSIPELSGIVDTDTLAKNLHERFINTYFTNDFDDNLFKNEKIEINDVSIQAWLSRQPTGTIEKLESSEPLENIALNVYTYMIKASVKPQLDCTAPFSYPALQTIAYHDKFVNAIFCPVFRQLKNRILNCLKSKFQIYCNMSPEEFENKLSNLYDSDALKNKYHRELDIGKYDKSQGLVALMFDVR